jgi:peptide/nickel transport system substrate-binding protein
MAESLFYGAAELAAGLLPPHNWAHEANVLQISYDDKRAMQLLDSAGYPDPDGPGPGMRFTITFKVSTSEFRKLIATVVQKDLERVGIGVNIRAYEFGTFFSDVNRGNFQMCMLLWVGESDPDIYRIAFSTTGPRNRGKYSDPDVDQWVELARAAENEEEQKKYYSLVQKKVAEDCPYISLWYESNMCIMRKELKGMHLTPDSDYRVLKDIYFTTNTKTTRN